MVHVISSLQVAYHYRNETSYEPECFSGLVWRQWAPKMTLLIFVSGKMVVTGATTMDVMEKAVNAMYPVLAHFQR